MEALLPLIIQAVSGLIGGNVAGLINKARSLGPLLNSVLGAVGGVAGAQGVQASGVFDQLLGGLSGGAELGAQAGIGAVAGLILPLLGSFFKKK